MFKKLIISFVLLLFLWLPSHAISAVSYIAMDELAEGSSTVATTWYTVGYTGSTPYRWTLASMFNLKFATLTDAKFCTYASSTGKISCNSDGPDITAAANNTFTGTTIFKNTFTLQTVGGTTVWVGPTSAVSSGVTGLMLVANSGASTWLESTANCVASGSSDGTTFECKTPTAFWKAIESQYAATEPTDGFVPAWYYDAANDRWQLSSGGEQVVDNSTASHAIYKDSDGYVANQVVLIDAHAGSTTITLIPGICPMITNVGQAAADINNALPAVGAGKCFVALATTAQAANYWRLTAAAANTVCLNRTCGKDFIQFPTPAVGDTFTCMSDGTNWYCYDRDSDAAVGDL